MKSIGALIVDDQDDIRFLIRMIIESANQELYVTSEAAGGREALSRIDADDPTVIVLDHMMPGMTGIETAQQILSDRPGQAIILCSAYLDDRLRDEARGLGIEECLTKGQVNEIPAALRRVARG